MRLAPPDDKIDLPSNSEVAEAVVLHLRTSELPKPAIDRKPSVLSAHGRIGLRPSGIKSCLVSKTNLCPSGPNQLVSALFGLQRPCDAGDICSPALKLETLAVGLLCLLFGWVGGTRSQGEVSFFGKAGKQAVGLRKSPDRNRLPLCSASLLKNASQLKLVKKEKTKRVVKLYMSVKKKS
jgi:hypothetical protein